MMIAGVSLSIACHRDSFDKGLKEGLTKTLGNYDPDKINFDEVQAGVSYLPLGQSTNTIEKTDQKVAISKC